MLTRKALYWPGFIFTKKLSVRGYGSILNSEASELTTNLVECVLRLYLGPLPFPVREGLPVSFRSS